MCGFFGSWDDDKKRSVEIASECVKQLQHRGPDEHHVFTDARSGLTIGHTRLSIIGLDDGQQPIVSDRTILCVNGEFYDYKKIRGELTALGFNFQTKCDSEIAGPLYQMKGLDFIHDLRGEFAFSLYDKEKEELYLFRDRFGIRPMFYAEFGDTFLFSSEMKAILKHPKARKKVSKKSALHQMMQVMVPGDTLFEGIKAVQPGHFLKVKKRGSHFDISEHQYWDINFSQENEYSPLSDEDAISLCRSQLINSIALRLEADVPVGCYLSGGIDSCSILGLASAIQQSPIQAFTIKFEDDRYDESKIAKLMAEKTSAVQKVLNVKSQDLYGDSFLKSVWHSERTFYNTLGVAKYLMSRSVREENFKVVITGEGSDELLGGYSAFKMDMFLHDKSDESKQALTEFLDRNKLFAGSVISTEKREHPLWNEIVGFTPSWFQPWLKVYDRTMDLLNKDTQSELDGYDPAAEIIKKIDTQKLEGRHPLDKVQYTWIKTMLEGQILNWGGDRVDMAHSVESRPAFLDHHFAESMTRVHPTQRIKGTTEKWVLREAMKHILPRELYEREKFSFMAPPAHTKKEPMPQLESLISRFLNPESVRTLGIFDETAVGKLVKSYRESDDHALKTQNDILLNHLLCLHILNDDEFI